MYFHHLIASCPWIGLGLDAVSLVLPFVPAVGASLKVIGVADDVHDAGNAVDALSDSNKLISNAKNVPNPYGRKGGIAHQTEIQKQISKYFPDAVKTEVKIDTPGGHKPYRFLDFSVTENGHAWYGNVGRQNKNGLPCARERQVIEDLERLGFDVRFFPYK